MTIVLNLHPCKTFILIKRAIKKKFFISPIQLLILLKKYLNTKILLEFIFFIYSLFFIKNKIYFLSDSIFLLTRMKESTLNFVDGPCAVSSFFASQRSKVFTLFSDLVKKYHTTFYQIKNTAQLSMALRAIAEGHGSKNAFLLQSCEARMRLTDDVRRPWLQKALSCKNLFLHSMHF